MTSAPTKEIRSEYPATLGDRDFYVSVKQYPEDGSYNAGQKWVQVEEHVVTESGLGWDKLLFPSTNVETQLNDLDAIRDAFREVRNRLKSTVRAWRQYVGYAELETGGKRGYYTKHANQYFKRIPQCAADWKLCKQIWKVITKL